jgi:hypothetical protein
MANEKKKRPTLTTPKGIAAWPKLNEPDYKWKPEGEFSVTLNLDDAAGQQLIAELEPLYAAVEQDEKYLAASAAFKKNAKNRNKTYEKAPPPWVKPMDDNGNDLPGYVFKFRMVASGVSSKDGKPWSRRPMLFDSNNRPTKAVVGGGSEIRVAFQPVVFATPLTYGMTLALSAVQVLKLEQFGGFTAESYGFSKEDGGFDGTEFNEETEKVGAATSQPATDSPKEASDF